MPEGPEVRIIVNQLSKILVGKTIVNIVGLPKLDPLVVKAINCKGKFIYFTLKAGEENIYLGNHLAMTGRWVLHEPKHIRAIINYLEEGKTQNIYFDDMRKFGSIFYLSEKELTNKLNSLGPDVFELDFTFERFKEMIKLHANRVLADFLIDQSILSGIGNYLRADIMYTARLHPKRKINSLSAADISRLFKSIKLITSHALKQHGTTIKTYKDVNEQTGNYSPLIYGKTKDFRNNDIVIMKISGRSVYWVPNIQL